MPPPDAPSSANPPAALNQQQNVPSNLIAQVEAAIQGHLKADDDEPRHLSKSKTHPVDTKRRLPGSGTSTEASHPNRSETSFGAVKDAPATPSMFGADRHQIDVDQDGFESNARVADDGRVNINIHQKSRRLSDLLVPTLSSQLSLVAAEADEPRPPCYTPPTLGGTPGQPPPPKLNVVIQVVGSRGDVQPFVALGQALKSTYGHRVRLASHPTFKEFVEENGLEFFSIGGDPSELMAFMVKNPGLMPGIDALKSGDVGKRRKGMEEILVGCWRSCIEAGNGLGPAPQALSSTQQSHIDAGIDLDANSSAQPFIADAIIANPPSFAHIHIAEKLGLPLHMMFTMPWSPTQSFPHPLANIQSSNADVNMTNFVSYALVEMLTWQGLGDVINRFRNKVLSLDDISLIWAPGMLSRLRVPFTYCWSPALIPKPADWARHISVSGFYFLSLASSYTPEPDLAAFLATGPPPVYIGFGSIVVDDPNAMTELIFKAIQKAGVRALVSKGWGGLGADALSIPDGVFMLGNVPHDWLFEHVSCVVHHGGAGTTAAGIASGKPTVVVPFFGDQPFWGAMMARAGAGPFPIPYKQLTSDKLATAIEDALKPEVLAKARELGGKIKEEKGSEAGAKSFHDHLEMEKLRCSLAPNRVAVWRIRRTDTRLSALAASILASENMITFADLKLYRPIEYDTDTGPWDPISGGASALIGTIGSLAMGVADFPVEIFRSVKQKKETLRTSGSSRDSPASGSTTPPEPIQGQSPVGLGPNPSSPSDPTSVSPVSDKALSENTIRSSSDLPKSDTPRTSQSSSSTRTAPLNHVNSLKDALRTNLTHAGARSRSRSGSLGSRSGSPSTQQKEFDPSALTLENSIGAGKSIARIVGAGMKSPMDFTLAIARGFHNAPKLYGDDTVRQQEKITDLQSGLKAAGKEFGYGFFDGITGLVTQPLRGAEKEGTAGLLKGIGKGMAGLVLKPGAAIWGIPGYALMGLTREIQKRFGSNVLNYMISVRIAQGFEESLMATTEERQHIINTWSEYKAEYQSIHQHPTGNEVEAQESGRLSPKGFLQTRHLSFDERKKLHEARKDRQKEQSAKGQTDLKKNKCPFCRQKAADRADQNLSPIQSDDMNDSGVVGSDLEFEHAIHTSVEATSQGNPEEDAMVERAIRASMRELGKLQPSTMSDEEALDHAIQSSIAQANSSSVAKEQSSIEAHSTEEVRHQQMIEQAIQNSLRDSEMPSKTTEEAG